VAAICVLVAGLVPQAGADSSASPPRLGPYEETSVDLFVNGRVEQHRRFVVGAEGFSSLPLELWIYEDPQGRACADTIADQPPRSRRLMTAVEVEDAFRERVRMETTIPGEHSFCAYLGPFEEFAFDTSFKARRVLTPLLKAGRAKRTVTLSLKRHGFADRVVKNLETKCRRRDRSEFACRFSSAFPGYSLSGRGRVELARRISYRLRAKAQSRRVVLTDENEGSFPG
jgi:hypothetical protein